MLDSTGGAPVSRLAAIDMGSNAIRLRIVELGETGRHVLDEQRLNVRLGLATYGRGFLDEASIAAATGALRLCRDACRKHGVSRYRAVATAALRDAPNRDDFVDGVRSDPGLAIEVIPGEEEARLLYLGLAPHERADGPVAMIELGSGSLQIAAGSGSQATYLDCLPLGALRLALEHGGRDRMSPQALDGLRDALRAGLARSRERLRALGVKRLLGAGGGFRAVALVGRPTSDAAWGGRSPGNARTVAAPASAVPGAVSTLSLSLEHARKLSTRLAALDARQKEALGLPPDRADSVTPSACLAAELLGMLELDEMQLVDTNLRDGILADLAADPSRGTALPV